MNLAIPQTQPKERLLGRSGQEFRTLILHAVTEEMAGQTGGHDAEILVVLIQEDETPGTGTQPAVERPLGLLDSLEGTEAQQVRPADIGNETVIRLRYTHQFLYVVWVIGPHLNNRNLRLRSY